MVANHERQNIPHDCNDHCSYSREFDNEITKCSQCHREGRDTIVYGKLVGSNDGLAQGIAKYVWSGFVIECPRHGEIYRSRKYWYGNTEPKDVTRVEIIHVWSKDDVSRLGSDVTPRKVVEAIGNVGRFVSYVTYIYIYKGLICLIFSLILPSLTMVSDMVLDQVAPSYWTPNKDAQVKKFFILLVQK